MVVGPLVQAAIDEFHWELACWFCRRPWVWFSYFRVGKALVFRDFTDAEERTEKGLAAVRLGGTQGLGQDRGQPAEQSALSEAPCLIGKSALPGRIFTRAAATLP